MMDSIINYELIIKVSNNNNNNGDLFNYYYNIHYTQYCLQFFKLLTRVKVAFWIEK